MDKKTIEHLLKRDVKSPSTKSVISASIDYAGGVDIARSICESEAVWAVSEAELKDPTNLSKFDKLVAPVDSDSEGVNVYRDGTPTNTWSDGSHGVSVEESLTAELQKQLFHPNSSEPTHKWVPVIHDSRSGLFIRWA